MKREHDPRRKVISKNTKVTGFMEHNVQANTNWTTQMALFFVICFFLMFFFGGCSKTVVISGLLGSLHLHPFGSISTSCWHEWTLLVPHLQDLFESLPNSSYFLLFKRAKDEANWPQICIFGLKSELSGAQLCGQEFTCELAFNEKVIITQCFFNMSLRYN